MNDLISPAYQMKLVNEVKEAIWVNYPSYQDVQFYISKWHEEDPDWGGLPAFLAICPV